MCDLASVHMHGGAKVLVYNAIAPYNCYRTLLLILCVIISYYKNEQMVTKLCRQLQMVNEAVQSAGISN